MVANFIYIVRSLYDYDAQSPEELSLDQGQIIGVLATYEDGWWDGELQIGKSKKVGLFPSNFTERI